MLTFSISTLSPHENSQTLNSEAAATQVPISIKEAVILDSKVKATQIKIRIKATQVKVIQINSTEIRASMVKEEDMGEGIRWELICVRVSSSSVFWKKKG